MLAMMLMLAAPRATPPPFTPSPFRPSLFTAAQGRLSATVPDADRADRRYRVDADIVVDDDKERALGMTGEQCNVVGARRCTKKPRTWLTAPIGP